MGITGIDGFPGLGPLRCALLMVREQLSLHSIWETHPVHDQQSTSTNIRLYDTIRNVRRTRCAYHLKLTSHFHGPFGGNNLVSCPLKANPKFVAPCRAFHSAVSRNALGQFDRSYTRRRTDDNDDDQPSASKPSGHRSRTASDRRLYDIFNALNKLVRDSGEIVTLSRSRLRLSLSAVPSYWSASSAVCVPSVFCILLCFLLGTVVILVVVRLFLCRLLLGLSFFTIPSLRLVRT